MSERPRSASELLTALDTPSWVVRREVVAELASLGRAAAEAICVELQGERRNETRLAALVDALVASSAPVDDLLLAL
ncbi:MAG TPA: hypothetical protein VEX18_03265, partial [Polyangiaceae bacterium]|nr:hypothetical protein [Polyangiaceae bacterium]